MVSDNLPMSLEHGTSTDTRAVTRQVFRANNPALTETWEEQTDTAPVEELAPAARRPAWKEIIRHFSPSWFSVTMGTGVTSVLLNRLPYSGHWLYWLSVAVFVLNTALFSIASIVSIIRYVTWPNVWSIMIRDPHHSLFLGALPIGFTTVINMVVYVCVPAWGPWAVTMAWILWIIDSIVAIVVTFLVPYTTMTRPEQSTLHKFNAVQLMPLSSTIAAAATGSLVAGVLPNTQHALWTMIASYALLGVGLPMVMTVLGIYYQRLTLHHLPPREVIVSVFLPVSPLCLGSYSVLRLGIVAVDILPQTQTLTYEGAGVVLYSVGCITAIILWAYSLAWLAYAVASIMHQRHFPFNMGWWGFTFPLGMLALATIAIGTELSSGFLRVFGTVLAVLCMLLWLVVVAGTVKGVVTGQLLYASCVRTAEMKQQSGNQQA